MITYSIDVRILMSVIFWAISVVCLKIYVGKKWAQKPWSVVQQWRDWSSIVPVQLKKWVCIQCRKLENISCHHVNSETISPTSLFQRCSKYIPGTYQSLVPVPTINSIGRMHFVELLLQKFKTMWLKLYVHWMICELSAKALIPQAILFRVQTYIEIMRGWNFFFR